MRKLSTGPLTLGTWLELCSDMFGPDTAPTRFIQARIDDLGADMKVTTNEEEFFFRLRQMHTHEEEGKQHLA